MGTEPAKATRRTAPSRASHVTPWGRGGGFFEGWGAQNAAAVPDDGPDYAPTRARSRLIALGGLVVAVATTIIVPASSASADPSAHTWYRLRMCESGNNYSINTGNGHYGAYQFDLSTWRSVGGSGYPYRASKAEQDARALILYRLRGWQPWQCARILGLRDDSDARSGKTSDISIAEGGSSSSSAKSAPRSVPAFPGGSHWYRYGETSAQIKTFQNQMHERGYFPAGTGQYGPKTLAMVKHLQQLNGLVANGYIGPNTWRLAWTGKYTTPGTAPTGTANPSIPAFPGGSHWYRYGETSAQIKTFQNQMHERGYFPAGTGRYGPKTLAMVKHLQQLNGLVPNGYIGPNTWRLAWTGKYTA